MNVRSNHQCTRIHDGLRRASLGWMVGLVFLMVGEVRSQTVDVGGRAFVDYFYQLGSPDPASEGLHGFTYRRLYLTADARLSEAFRSRARLEANDGTTGERGPVPYVKDLWIEWSYSGGHTATLGVMKPPAYDRAEDVWRYRSLEKMVLDFQGINTSRDFGIRFDGPATPGAGVRYAFMLANNSAARPETDVYKRGYGLVSFHPHEAVVLYVSADRAGYGDAREGGTRLSAFGGVDGDPARIGMEAFWSELQFVEGAAFRNAGVSLFGAYRLGPQWELVARADFTGERRGTEQVAETFVLAGAAYSPIEQVRIIPNLWMFRSDAAGDLDALGRITVDVSF